MKDLEGSNSHSRKDGSFSKQKDAEEQIFKRAAGKKDSQ
jgi:hypothetical protein